MKRSSTDENIFCRFSISMTMIPDQDKDCNVHTWSTYSTMLQARSFNLMAFQCVS